MLLAHDFQSGKKKVSGTFSLSASREAPKQVVDETVPDTFSRHAIKPTVQT
jgi:hypothetical protein